MARGDLTATMIAERYAVPYDGGRRIDWCHDGEAARPVIDRITVGAAD